MKTFEHVILLPLSRGLCAKIDADAPEEIWGNKWCAKSDSRGHYSVERFKGKKLSHAVLGIPPKGLVVDHINRDPLDNRRCNLRFCSPSENRRNSKKSSGTASKYKGVRKLTGGRWRAVLGFRGKTKSLGCFETEEAAAVAYDQAAKNHFGEFAATNF